MPKTPDFTQVAHRVFQQAVGELPKQSAQAPTPKQEAGRKGGLKGGKKRMDSLTDTERRELALKAANARWAQKTPAPQETAGGRKR